MVIQNVSPLHTKGQEDKSKSAYVTRPIHHSKEGQSVSCNQIFSPKYKMNCPFFTKCMCENGECGALYEYTVLIKVFSETVSPAFLKECGKFCFITFHTLGVRKETNLPLQVLEMFVGLVTLVLVR